MWNCDQDVIHKAQLGGETNKSLHKIQTFCEGGLASITGGFFGGSSITVLEVGSASNSSCTA